MAVLSFRRNLTGGMTASVYIADDPSYDPALDPLEQDRVKPGDQLILFSGGSPRIQIRDVSNTTWELLDWLLLPNKPIDFLPSVHTLDGDRHMGKLPISSVEGHTISNPVHVQIEAVGTILGGLGNTLFGSTL